MLKYEVLREKGDNIALWTDGKSIWELYFLDKEVYEVKKTLDGNIIYIKKIGEKENNEALYNKVLKETKNACIVTYNDFVIETLETKKAVFEVKRTHYGEIIYIKKLYDKPNIFTKIIKFIFVLFVELNIKWKKKK